MANDGVAKLADAPKVLTAEQAKTAAPSAAQAMPAGDARREQMKRDMEALQSMQADFASKYETELGAIDSAKLKHVDNEIGQYSDPYQRRDGSEVEGALDDYRYFWAESRGNNGMEVENCKAIGWVLVESGMPEEQRRKTVDGSRRWGTAVLMRMPKSRAAFLQAAERRKVLSRTEGFSLKLLEEAERVGVKIHDLTSDKTPEWIRQNAQAQRSAAEAARSTYVGSMRQVGRSGQSRTLASTIANARLERAIREGTVPGLTPGA